MEHEFINRIICGFFISVERAKFISNFTGDFRSLCIPSVVRILGRFSRSPFCRIFKLVDQVADLHEGSLSLGFTGLSGRLLVRNTGCCGTYISQNGFDFLRLQAAYAHQCAGKAFDLGSMSSH